MKRLDKIVVTTLATIIFSNITYMMYLEDGTWLKLVVVSRQMGKEILGYFTGV